MEQVRATSPNLIESNIQKIAELFPSVITENQRGGQPFEIDFVALEQELSDYIVEGPVERFQLDWPGKRESLLLSNTPTDQALRPVRDESISFDTTQNLFIEGDNLEALKLLQNSYLGKVKLIYIDPPYNTGNDFVYADDFKETVEEYDQTAGKVDDVGNRLVANRKDSGRYHSNWLSMMYPRLRLARNLLTDDGVIFISIDDNEVAHLRNLCDEVFSESNFICEFIWKKGGTGKNDSQFAIVEHEYVLAYARKATNSKFNLDPEATVTTSYNREDETGRYSLVRLDSKTIRYAPTLEYEIVGPDGQKYFPEQPSGKSHVACWRWGKDKVAAEYDSLVFEKGFVYTKNYQREGARPRSLLIDERFGVTRTGRAEAESTIGKEGLFDFPKPVRLIRHFTRIFEDKNAVVLDFFAGSGTTAQAVMEQNAADGGNRKFIMVQLDEPCNPKSEAAKAGYKTIAEISKERLRCAGKKILEGKSHEDWNKDIGFRVLKIDESNRNHVYLTPGETHQEEISGLSSTFKPDRTHEDLFFQVLLDWGLSLSEEITTEKRGNNTTIFTIKANAETYICCLADSYTQDLLNEMFERKAEHVVLLDGGFDNDSQLINAEQQFTQLYEMTELKVL